MLTVISPAKSLDYESPAPTSKSSQPDFLDDAEVLVGTLRKMSKKKLGELMGISEALAELNHQRYADWSRPFTAKNAKQAVLAFSGDVYLGLEAATFRAKDFTFAQDHLRILSGLYGVLRPLDLMQAHRLEMGTRLKTRRGKLLYEFWGEKITENLNEVLANHKQAVLVNLASNEYFKSVKPRDLDGSVVTPVFREIKGGKSRTIATFAKRARGRMLSWMVRNRIDRPEDLPAFNADGYEFISDESTDDTLVFARPQPPPVGR
jgi:cytoplasmic iron level regulating protein YaaA (DUF328/UPF0246 family)